MTREQFTDYLDMVAADYIAIGGRKRKAKAADYTDAARRVRLLQTRSTAS